ncbi:DUF917 family protein [Brevibacillus sp. HD3.3A]|uniref:DUF917 domain-containing protein n=1 Tax=Brevibacillus sp. HD3.3A TaxID=2738979 RepID=UPI00156B6777|nr:DUF917 family protein [Brevibacillus sp. HD3.3A]UED70198.1 DUF917 family protein [Brevibacillus sp. HD3.3A]
MAKIILDQAMMEAAVYGGAVLGGGGGGWIEDGMETGRLALEVGSPVLVTADEMNDDDLLATVALVGAPAAENQYVKPMHYVRALQLLEKTIGQPIKGIITNENGAGTTVNGWFQAAVTGLPVIDLPCNGRAHPTGSMGAMNLHEVEGYISHQAAVGGKDELYHEVCVSGQLQQAAGLVRKVSVETGGLVVVARNPISVGYAREHGAPGAISQAIEVGQALLGAKGEAAIEAVCRKLGGRIVTAGSVDECELTTAGGFDVGRVVISGHEMTFWNEYMTLEHKGERLGTFPDLIMTLDANTAKPIVSAEIEKGQQITVIHVPKENLLLSATMRNKQLLAAVEGAVGKQILPYLFG